MIERAALVAAIHGTAPLLVAAVTGGGVAAIGDLLSVPGASRTVLEVVVPYAAPSLAAWIGREPVQATSVDTAVAMAERAAARAAQLAPGSEVLGLGVTAALVTDRPRRGLHRADLALATGHGTTEIWSVVLEKGARDRAGEDRVVADLALMLVAQGCGVTLTGEIDLLPGDQLRWSRGAPTG